MTFHKNDYKIFEAFHLASLQIVIFDHFWTIHLIFEIDAWNFLYFNIES